MATNIDPTERLSELVKNGFVSIVFSAKFLNLSRTSVYALMDSGDLPYAKFGRARRIPHAALLEYAKKQIVGS